MPAEINDEALEYLLARAGLSLSEAQKAELKTVYAGIAAMAERAHGRAGARLRLCRGGPPVSDPIPTIAEAARLIAAKELSPVELTRACLDRVRALDDRLHAFVHLTTEERAL